MDSLQTTEAALPMLPARSPDSHKGDFGRALIIGGSRGMSGAIGLAGMAALRGGAGLVKLAVPDPCLETVANFEPSYMTVPLPADDHGRLGLSGLDQILQLAEQASVVALGPGLGRSAELTELVGRLYRDLPRPLVVDADGLNALSEQPDVLRMHAGPRILTPHPGEFGRLARSTELDTAGQRQRAAELAADWDAVILLKGSRTLITNGSNHSFNSAGNPGMATGGAGDVLTGLITALLCQGLSPFDAARLGAHVHGLAGDLAAAELGEVGMIASDLVRFLPYALKDVGTRKEQSRLGFGAA